MKMEKPNIIILSVDSLAAKHLGCYEYEKATSPHIDALANDGVLCERLFCPAIPTFPSYTTLYTGQHPINHGIIAHPCKNQLDKDAPCLPWLLLKDGYQTCAVDSLMRSRLWFGRGYEHYIDPSIRHTMLHLAVTCEELNAQAISWLQNNSQDPFFLFIHYWDPHWPYRPPEQYRELFYEGNDPFDKTNHSLEEWWQLPLGAAAKNTWLRTTNGLITDADYVSALYDQEIRYLDDNIGKFIAALDDLGLTENTLLIIKGDHGESMIEHGIYFDHHGLYDCTIHVPLIMRWPDVLPKGTRLPQVFQMSDIAPTLLEAASVSIPSEMDGKSFLPLLTGKEEEGGHERVISSECYWGAKWSIRTDSHKLILARKPDLYGNPPKELYALESDPEEQCNIALEQPDIVGRLEEELERYIADWMQKLGLEKDPVLTHDLGVGFAG